MKERAPLFAAPELEPTHDSQERGVEPAELLDLVEDSASEIDARVSTILQFPLPDHLSADQQEELTTIGERAKRLALGFKEAVGAYVRLVVLGGFVLMAGGHRDQASLYEHQPFREKVERARLELSTEGITSEQKRAYIPIAGDLLFRGVTPVGYDYKTALQQLPEHLIKGRNIDIGPQREDAWRLYLGLPQEEGTFDISDYRPKNAREDIYYYRIRGFFRDYFSNAGAPAEGLKSLVTYIENTYGSGGEWRQEDDDIAGVMGTYTLSKGQDEHGHFIAYYDKWDLDVPSGSIDSAYAPLVESLPGPGIFGRPLEIYDRVYYDPVTFEPLSSLE